jgi:CRP-like cAMP-binding protein
MTQALTAVLQPLPVRRNLVDLPSVHRVSHRRGDTVPLPTGVLWRIEGGLLRAITWDERRGVISTLGLFGAGDLVGEPLAGTDPYELECLTDATLSYVPPILWSGVMESLFQHVRQTEELLAMARIVSMRERVKCLLYWLGDRFGRITNEGLEISLRLTHQHLADLLGTSRVTVTRILSEFQRVEAVSCSHRRLVLKARLEEL